MGIVIRQTIKGTIVNYLGTLIGFVTTFFVLTRYLTVQEVGLTRILIDSATLFAGLAQIGSTSSIIKFFPFFRSEENKHNGFFFWTTIIPLGGFCIFAFLYLILKPTIVDTFVDKSPLFVDYYYYILPLAFVFLYQLVFEANANVLMRIVVPRFIREVLIRLLLLVVYVLYAFKFLNLDTFVMLFCMVYVIATLCNVLYVMSFDSVSLRYKKGFLNANLIRDYYKYSSFLLVASLVGTVTPIINTFFISAEMGLAFTGVYTIAMYMAALVEIPSRSLNAITGPTIANDIKNNDMSNVSKILKQVSLHQFMAACFILFVIWTNIDLIFKILPNGDTYVAGKWVVLILGFSKLINSSVSLVGTIVSFSRYYAYSLLFTLILTIAMILFINWFIPLWGITGAALAMLYAYVVYYVVFLIFVKYKLNVSPFSIEQLKIILVFGVMIGINYFFNYVMETFLSGINIFSEVVLRALITFVVCVFGVYMLLKLNVSEYLRKFAERVTYLKNCRVTRY